MQKKTTKIPSIDSSNNHLVQSGRGQKKIIKKSIFLATAYLITSLEDGNVRINSIKKEMKKATHNAWALRLLLPNGLMEDSFDDGELSGCAGKPILFILQKMKLINVLVIVTRFYGGIHLGPSKLIQEYSGVAKELIKNIGFKPYTKKKNKLNQK